MTVKVAKRGHAYHHGARSLPERAPWMELVTIVYMQVTGVWLQASGPCLGPCFTKGTPSVRRVFGETCAQSCLNSGGVHFDPRRLCSITPVIHQKFAPKPNKSNESK